MLWPKILLTMGLIGSLVGLITLVRPIARIRISSRGRAGLLLAVSVLATTAGAAWARQHHCGCAPRPIIAERVRALQPSTETGAGSNESIKH
jgi:hypothetical protein